MSNALGYHPAPPPPAAPALSDGGALTFAAIAIGWVLGLSLIAGAVVLVRRHRQVYGHGAPKAAYDVESAAKPLPSPAAGGSKSMMEGIAEESEREPSTITAPPARPTKSLSAEDLALNKQLHEAWSAPRPAPAAAPATENKKPLTMDEKLRQKAAARIEAAARGRRAREERARYLKAGGRPNAAGAPGPPGALRTANAPWPLPPLSPPLSLTPRPCSLDPSLLLQTSRPGDERTSTRRRTPGRSGCKASPPTPRCRTPWRCSGPSSTTRHPA